ncbi:MAG: hypothetical protein HYR94_14700 [Chloroflexi bacterium]|nr:hypothetical protein [Chloroflexota bacterium]
MSQILDNLNKAALIGLPHTNVGARLVTSLVVEPSSRVALEHTQACVNEFRAFCLARNLLDFSLRIETFYRHLWPVEGIRQYLTWRYRHLIVDNLEEDTPFAHTVLRDWLPTTESALLVNDEDAGYRIFLGANWRTAQSLAGLAAETLRLSKSRVAPPDMLALGEQLGQILSGRPPTADRRPAKTRSKNRKSKIQNPKSPDPRRVITFQQERFYPQMIEWVINRINSLLAEGVPPEEIVVLAPFVSDALRFSFTHRMAQRGLPARSHRPSRPLSEEPAAKTILTSSFDQIEGDVRERISYQAGNRFDRLRVWLQNVQTEPSPPVLDHFFSRLFDEILAQPGFGFHGQQEAGEVVANLIDSARMFRRVAEQVPNTKDTKDTNNAEFPSVHDLNRAYLETIEQGIMAAQYIRSWDAAPEAAVLITPATTFLMSNRPVDYQFWLDAGSSGWWERIAQPLTHPYILAADWEPGRPWTDADEVAGQRDRLERLVLGLTRRCRKHIFILNAEVGEQGYEQRGQLLVALQQMLRQMQKNLQST